MTDYRIEELQIGGTWNTVGEVGSAATKGVAENLAPGVLTTLRVVAKNDVWTEYGAASEPI